LFDELLAAAVELTLITHRYHGHGPIRKGPTQNIRVQSRGFYYMYVSAATSGKREMSIVDCAVITDAVKWNERVLLLQTLGLLK
jgi:hypothetical protein